MPEKIFVPEEQRQKILERLTEQDVMEWMSETSRPYRDLMAYYKCAMMEVETKFNVLDEELSLRYDRNPIESIKTRLKSQPSIVGKLRRKNLPFTLESIENNIFDVAGVRVICSFPDDIYMLTDCLLRQDDVTLITKKDYIANPKENGYRSMHLIVEIPIFLSQRKKPMRVEVQLRTIAMDFWASLEHKLRYKKDIEDTEEIRRELKDCAEMSAQLDMRMNEMRKKLEKR